MTITADDKHYRARITKRVDFAQELWMIRIQPGGEFKFTPGQYATLGVQGEVKRSERPYSIASSPYENEIEFFFELVPHGELTPDIYGLFPRHLFISGPRSYGARHPANGDRHEHLPLTVIHRQRTRTRNQRTRMSYIFCPVYDAGYGAESFASTSRDPLSDRSNFDRAGKPARSTRGHSAG